MLQPQIDLTNHTNLVEQDYPHFIKYMGSKSKIMGFVLEGINDVYDGGAICDLFAGSASISGAIGRQVPVHSNDIQSYSALLAQTYLFSFQYEGMPSADQLIESARIIVDQNKKTHGIFVDYQAAMTLQEFNLIETAQQALIEKKFNRKWHLFLKNYSGTWWSAEQCMWIDALREVAESFRNSPCYSLIISSLMYSKAYTSQGTGHYAQYRDAKTESSMADILIYRKRSIAGYFKKKFDLVSLTLPTTASPFEHNITSLDYRECLNNFSGGTIYADPPYCFVHYSRFYHAIETLVLYDYPAIQKKAGTIVKGRYREDRHQSPFCIKSQVTNSFNELFAGVNESKSNLVLSYSNTGMITIDEIENLAKRHFSNKTIEILFTDHKHMTLGRQNDRDRDVEECLILVK